MNEGTTTVVPATVIGTAGGAMVEVDVEVVEGGAVVVEVGAWQGTGAAAKAPGAGGKAAPLAPQVAWRVANASGAPSL